MEYGDEFNDKEERDYKNSKVNGDKIKNLKKDGKK